MFTGIIEEQGTIKDIAPQKNLITLSVQVRKIFKGTHVGDSICMNGVCLTVSEIKKPDVFLFDLMKETLASTNFKNLRKKSKVNLERALTSKSRFGGHFVTGHVDTVGRIQEILRQENFIEFRIGLEKRYFKFLVPKGSVTIDGISLTVGEVKKSYFSVYLIPHTLRVTTLGTKIVSDEVNIETDLLAKYILKQNN